MTQGVGAVEMCCVQLLVRLVVLYRASLWAIAWLVGMISSLKVGPEKQQTVK